MPYPMEIRFHSRPGLRFWLTILIAMALLAAIVFVFTLIAVGVFVVLVPVLAVAAVLYRILPKSWFAQRRRKAADSTIIDGEFRVLDASEAERLPPHAGSPRTDQAD
jgi:small-conductance mechanosensitive channel